jgi:hypothetical protein
VGTETRGDDNIEKNLQKLIQSDWIGRFLLDVRFNSPPNRLDDCETFVEIIMLGYQICHLQLSDLLTFKSFLQILFQLKK